MSSWHGAGTVRGDQPASTLDAEKSRKRFVPNVEEMIDRDWIRNLEQRAGLAGGVGCAARPTAARGHRLLGLADLLPNLGASASAANQIENLAWRQMGLMVTAQR